MVDLSLHAEPARFHWRPDEETVHDEMSRQLLTLAVLFLGNAFGQGLNILPLAEVRAGMHGTGKTVFRGDRIDDFGVEILGVLENIGPKQSLILARLSGGPLEQTGVMQGMSGSPVYIGGKLIGAVAMAFPFSKEPIAGIRPIEEMLRVGSEPDTGHRQSRGARHVAWNGQDLTAAFSPLEAVAAGGSRLENIATPLSFGGFTQTAIDVFAPRLRALGMEPRQGTTVGGGRLTAMGNPANLKPGSMISVQMMSGDLSIGADGTVTAIDAGRVYAFGHRFFALGPTGLPFARAEVISLMPNLNTSFKLSEAKELMGIISQDRDAAIAGRLGQYANLIPVTIHVRRGARKIDSYEMSLIDDRLLAPVLLQMAVFSSIDATERSVGGTSLALQGSIQFADKRAPVELSSYAAADTGSALQASLSAMVPLAYILQGGFDGLKIKSVNFDIDSSDSKHALQIEDVMASRREVHPGDKLSLTTLFTGENGAEVSRTIPIQIPTGCAPGTIFITVADGSQTSVADLRQTLNSTPRSPDQLLETVRRLKGNTRAYARLWRADPDFQVGGSDLPGTPPSVALVLAGTQGIAQTRNSKLSELEIDPGEVLVTGSKTIQIEVKP